MTYAAIVGDLYLEAAFSLDNLGGWNAPNEATKALFQDSGTIGEEVTGAQDVLGDIGLGTGHRSFLRWWEGMKARKTAPAEGQVEPLPDAP